MVQPIADPRPQIRVCQHQTCRQQGSAAVLLAVQQAAPAGVAVVGSGCLGQCGNGPMLLILPEQIWYSRVQPKDGVQIVAHHWQGGEPVPQRRYRPPVPAPEVLLAENAPQPRPRWLWAGLGMSVVAIALLLVLGVFWWLQPVT